MSQNAARFPKPTELLFGILLVASAWIVQTLNLWQPSKPLDQPKPAPAAVSEVASVGITVADLDRAADFYTTVLTFERVDEREQSGAVTEQLTGISGARARTARLRLGNEIIELTQYLAPTGKPFPSDSRSNDRWFQHIAIVVPDMDKAYAHLEAHHVQHVSPAPQTLPEWNPNAGGISAFYFKDPEGHVLEAIHFPPGKGDPRWQQPTERLFSGIDHTAIVVADTERSLMFYRDLLGMRIAGASENYGSEQEQLNNVPGAHLRITGLRAAQGPGVELLEYLAPSDGRDYPGDSRSCDLVSWTTALASPSIDELAKRLQGARVRWISSTLVTGLDLTNGFSAATQVRDPDGHVLVIARPAALGDAQGMGPLEHR